MTIVTRDQIEANYDKLIERVGLGDGYSWNDGQFDNARDSFADTAGARWATACQRDEGGDSPTQYVHAHESLEDALAFLESGELEPRFIAGLVTGELHEVKITVVMGDVVETL